MAKSPAPPRPLATVPPLSARPWLSAWQAA